MPIDVREVATHYIAEGFAVVPIPAGSKGPRIEDWQTRTFTEKDFQPTDNIGLRLGDPSGGLVDIDLDAVEAIRLAKKMLPTTERIHGRKSKRASHQWYIAKGLATTQFTDLKKQMIVELRSTGGQTVVPASIHPSGEPYVWEHTRPPSEILDPAFLLDCVRDLATCVLISRSWPPKGIRRELRLAWAGFLLRLGIEDARVIRILESAAELGGSDKNGIEHATRAVNATVEKLSDPSAQVISGRRILELLPSVGAQLLTKIAGWYGKTSQTAVDSVVDELNTKHFIVRIGKDEVIGTEDRGDLVFQQEKALQLRYANQLVKVGEKKKGADAGAAVFENKFSIWRKHRQRREYGRLVFAPPPLIADPRDYNLWKGFAVKPDEASCPEIRCDRFLTLIFDVICGGEPQRQEEYFHYLLDLMALTVQRPGEPSEIAVVMKGDRGVGKSVFATGFGTLFGKHFAQVAKPDQIVGKFNSTCSGKVVLFADEAFYAGDKKDLGALKVLITEKTLQIERKGIDPVTEPNFVHLFMASNEDWVAPAGLHERRFFALSVSDRHRRDFPWFAAVTEEMTNGGAAALLGFLLARTITPEKRRSLRDAPQTDELRLQQEHTLSPEMRWWKERLWLGSLANNNWPEHVQIASLHVEYLKWCDDLKIMRRITLVDFGRRVLEPWLGARKREGGAWVRPLGSLPASRALFDRVAGTATPWPEDGEDSNAKPDGSEF